MTDETPLDPPADADVTAAELALGLLDGQEHAAATRRLLAEPDFARAVERWRAHFAALSNDIAEVAPPPHLLARIEAALDGQAPRASNDNRRVRWWQAATGVSALAAAALVGVIVLRPAPAPRQPVVVTQATPALIASIAPTQGNAPIAAAYYPARGELRLAAAELTDPTHSAELWIIAADGVPHSLGVLPPGVSRIVAIDPVRAKGFVAGSKLVVTREQHGGSPDGTPKGPAIAAGALLTI